MQASKEQAKVVPMINGVEVKVGQIWRTNAGLDEEIIMIDVNTPLPITTASLNTYSISGKHSLNQFKDHLIKLVKDVEDQQGQMFTRSELDSLIEVNSIEIKFLSNTITRIKANEVFYYNAADKFVPETAPYFVKLNSIRNEIRKYKAKKKKLVALQCKLKEMYNASK